jgi:hypothetical protein
MEQTDPFSLALREGLEDGGFTENIFLASRCQGENFLRGDIQTSTEARGVMATTSNDEYEPIRWEHWTINNTFVGVTPGTPAAEHRLVHQSPPGAPRRRVATRVFIQRWDDLRLDQQPVVRRLNFDEPPEAREVELE